MKKLVDLKLELRVNTDKAFGVADGTEEGPKDAKGKRRLKVFWLPKSQVECDEPNPKIGKTYTFTMPEWLAVDKELV